MTYINIIVVCLSLLTSCSNEILLNAPIEEQGQEVIMLRTRSGESSNLEDKLVSLRLFIFANVAGNSQLVVNQLFKTSDATTGTPSGDTYFVKEAKDNDYRIAQLLQKSVIKVMIVANELTSMSNVTTESSVLQAQVNFYNRYSSSKGMDIQVEEENGIPMFATTGWLTPDQWSFNNDTKNIVELSLVRTLAKVTMTITKDVTRTETFTNAFVANIPQYMLLGDSIAAYSSSVVRTTSQPINFSSNTSDELSFYVPEYVISQANKEDKYAYIQINSSKDLSKNEILTYKIPLGNNVQGLYGGIKDGGGVTTMDPTEIKNLTPSDLKISRNCKYNIEVAARGNSGGGGDPVDGDLLIKTSVSAWTEKEVNGDINPPSLVLSSIDWKYSTGGKNRIYYWSNVEMKLSSIKECNKDGSGEVDKTNTPMDIFTAALTLTPFTDADLIKQGVNGYLDFILADNWLIEKNKIIKLTFDAGILRKEVTIRPPLVN